MTNPHQAASSVPHTSPPGDAEDLLDRALDALVRGDRRPLDRLRRIDPALADSTAEVFGLAERSGVSWELDPHESPPRGQRMAPTRFRRRVMPRFGAVAATVALAIGLASAISGFLPNRDNPTPTLLALDAPAALDGSTMPPVDADANEEVTGANLDQESGDVPPLSQDDCTGASRTREEVLEILSVAPADSSSITAADLPADAETVAALSETLHIWQACTVFGQTWQAMSLETEQFIREDIYGDPLIPVAYSARTLDEILDVREVVDRNRAERMSDPAVAGDQFVARIDPAGGIEISAAGSPTLSARADLLLISPSTGETLRAGPAIFAYEDGEWRIRSIEMEPIGGVATAGRVVALSAPGISWSTIDISVPIGGRIALTNDGSGGQHNFVVEGYNDGAPVDMPVGETVVWEVPADLAPGTYTFYCAIPGHRALMEGTITITSP